MDAASKKPATKKAAKKTQVGFEESLWDAANKLRGSVESAEYKHIVLSLIFLKFISDKFEGRKKAIASEYGDEYIDMVDFYAMDNVFYLPEDARWSHIQINAKQGDIAVKIDTALHAVEKNNKSLAGALPDNYFSRLGLDASKLSALIDTINNIDTIANQNEKTEEDLVGRVYEYFLGKFAASEGKGGGEFYTPKSIVTLIADMIEPFEGKIYDPCCGSGGMFVQSLKFINSHNGNQKNVSIYGQEYTNTTYKLAKMNLAVRGISGNLGDVAGDTFFKDQHPDLKADYIMANPPFNQKQWRADNELVDDARWAGYPTPPTGNANYAWIMHMISKLSEHGTAGFVLANGSMSSNTSGEGDIRQKIIENDLVDCMIALPGQLFYTTQIPVCLWFISKDKRGNNEKGILKRRDRQGETLFIDAREMGAMVNRTLKELTNDDIAKITQTYHLWRGEELATQNAERESASKEQSADKKQSANKEQEYADIAGYCKSATLSDIKANDYVLTPGRYVGAADIADDGIPFETKMSELSQTLYSQMNQADELDNAIRKNLQALGYGEEHFAEKRDSEERND
ncbi:N-6 DNA methylase [Pseudoalteromonas sp. SG41-5]|uniref:type I restriction-modification system subunit M n=1 Tax=Pseudoalteromonas sp. SG41-5 TaxID=2760975 RepID=UPI00160326A1|nr:class I SAM-dependent DNA methyltransferase [Pseudoalteromonas sp. SG41-5]MBB1470392.1 N-6 DNA methylase [Pseudoalteromonas sp. SG41-5]